MKKSSAWKTTSRLAILIVCAWYISVYGYTALQRSKATYCEQETRGGYIAKRCALGPEFWVVFRLYDAQSGELLAERTYDDPTFSPPIWEDGHVAYNPSPDDGDGLLTLPPSWLDKWRARMP